MKGRFILVVCGVAALLAAAALLHTLTRRPPPGPPRPPAPGARQVQPSPYREVRRVDTGLRVARGIAVTPDGRVYAAGDRAVHILGPSGDHTEFAVAGEPTCIAFSPDGVLYLGLRDHVAVVEHCGTPKATWPPPGANAVITSIAVAGDAIWVADAGNREVLLCSPAGNVISRLGRHPGPDRDADLIVPSPHLDVAAAAAAGVWLANPGRHRLQLHAADGGLVCQWGRFSNTDPAGFTGCCNPADFALTPAGQFVTADKGELARVRLFSADGQLLAMVADTAAFDVGGLTRLGAGLDVAADAQGRIYVLEPVRRQVLVFAAAGGTP